MNNLYTVIDLDGTCITPHRKSNYIIADLNMRTENNKKDV